MLIKGEAENSAAAARPVEALQCDAAAWRITANQRKAMARLSSEQRGAAKAKLGIPSQRNGQARHGPSRPDQAKAHPSCARQRKGMAGPGPAPQRHRKSRLAMSTQRHRDSSQLDAMAVLVKSGLGTAKAKPRPSHPGGDQQKRQTEKINMQTLSQMMIELDDAKRRIAELEKVCSILRADLLNPPPDVQECVIAKLNLVSGEALELCKAENARLAAFPQTLLNVIESMAVRYVGNVQHDGSRSPQVYEQGIGMEIVHKELKQFIAYNNPSTALRDLLAPTIDMLEAVEFAFREPGREHSRKAVQRELARLEQIAGG